MSADLTGESWRAAVAAATERAGGSESPVEPRKRTRTAKDPLTGFQAAYAFLCRLPAASIGLSLGAAAIRRAISARFRALRPDWRTRVDQPAPLPPRFERLTPQQRALAAELQRRADKLWRDADGELSLTEAVTLAAVQMGHYEFGGDQ